MKGQDCFTISFVLVTFIAIFLISPEQVNADFTFGIPVNLGPIVNSPYNDSAYSISSDGLSLYFCSNRSGGFGGYDLWVSTRATILDAWGPPVNLGAAVNSAFDEWGSCISVDGLSLLFNCGRPGGLGGVDLWMTRRGSTSDPWGAPTNLGQPVNSPYDDIEPSISPDGLSLFFSGNGMAGAINRDGGYGQADIWVTTRASLDDPWSTPVNLGPIVNSPYHDTSPDISSDGLALFFDSERPGGSGLRDMWVTMRKTTNDVWGSPINLGLTINSSFADHNPKPSADGSILYFFSDRPGGFGGYDLWQASIIPIVDFNGDEIVDITDLVILIEHWGQSEPSVDVGPMPWGDGIVDVKDLEVLMSYWQQEVLPFDLLSYWKLDETEGTIAQDSASDKNGTVNGNPIWQPTGGKVNGALQLDGIDDYVSTPFVLNPLLGSFSVFAWIKGGAPGQVVISQQGSAGGQNWLLAAPVNGNLMTELKGSSRGFEPLRSQVLITNGDWHRIGFVRDDSQRILYVDDIEVAKDTQNSLSESPSGLYIGADKSLNAAGFWNGLIDDVRIHNRAVIP